ncbi:MAG: hypothetical protein ACTHLE_03550 [Agriterribacter sp.]
MKYFAIISLTVIATLIVMNILNASNECYKVQAEPVKPEIKSFLFGYALMTNDGLRYGSISFLNQTEMPTEDRVKEVVSADNECRGLVITDAPIILSVSVWEPSTLQEFRTKTALPTCKDSL